MVRGAKAKPAALKILEGNPGKREIPVEPQPRKGLPQPPDYLDDVAKDAWQQVLEVMGHTGCITMAEAPLMELYATTYSNYRTATAEVEKHGVAIIGKDKSGGLQVKANPYGNQLHKYRDACAKLLMELGMTPVSRARIGLMDNDDDDELVKRFLA